MDILKGLNPQQKEAVTYGDGPLLILAGAGSGKTRALTARLAYLIKKQKINPGSILAITFTNKAAGEMRERVAGLLGEKAVKGMWIMTFHAACTRILRMDILSLQDRQGKGYSGRFVIYDENDTERLIKECLQELNLDTKRYAPKAVRFLISAAKNELIDADTFAGGHAAAVQAQIDGLLEAMEAATVVLVLQALPRKDYRALVDAHPPRKDSIIRW